MADTAFVSLHVLSLYEFDLGLADLQLHNFDSDLYGPRLLSRRSEKAPMRIFDTSKPRCVHNDVTVSSCLLNLQLRHF